MHIAGLDHVQLAMPPGGEPAARGFYGDLLGLTEVEKPKPLASRGGCWFEGAGAFVNLGVQADFVPATKAHVAFLVNDLEACFDALTEAGASVKRDAALEDVERIYAHDPFGNRLEFIRAGHGLSDGSSGRGTDA